MTDTATRSWSREDIDRVRAQVRDYVDNVLIPLEPVLTRDDAAADQAMADLKQIAKDRGIWALGHPTSIGGGGMPFMEYVYVNEIVGRSYWGTEALGTLSFQDCLMLLEFGTDEQKDRWIQPLFDGLCSPSIGMTEPEVAGSDPTLIQTDGAFSTATNG